MYLVQTVIQYNFLGGVIKWKGVIGFQLEWGEPRKVKGDKGGRPFFIIGTSSWNIYAMLEFYPLNKNLEKKYQMESTVIVWCKPTWGNLVKLDHLQSLNTLTW